MDWIVRNIRKRIGETAIYGVSGYMKRNGLDGLDGWVSMVEHGPKYKEKDWTKRDLRGVQIYEEEWTGGVDWTGSLDIRKRIGQQ